MNNAFPIRNRNQKSPRPNWVDPFAVEVSSKAEDAAHKGATSGFHRQQKTPGILRFNLGLTGFNLEIIYGDYLPGNLDIHLDLSGFNLGFSSDSEYQDSSSCSSWFIPTTSSQLFHFSNLAPQVGARWALSMAGKHGLGLEKSHQQSSGTRGGNGKGQRLGGFIWVWINTYTYHF